MSSKPDFESKESFDADIIHLERSDRRFREKCGGSCIVLLSVDGNSTKVSETHYSLQVTTDLLELSDGFRISDYIHEHINYRYYRYVKTCGEGCDVEIKITPLQMYSNMELLVDYDKNNGSIPTRNNNPQWRVAVNKQTSLDIKPKNNNKNQYLIGVYSLKNASFFLTATAIPKVTD